VVVVGDVVGGDVVGGDVVGGDVVGDVGVVMEVGFGHDELPPQFNVRTTRSISTR